jgi:hypothetical protein
LIDGPTPDLRGDANDDQPSRRDRRDPAGRREGGPDRRYLALWRASQRAEAGPESPVGCGYDDRPGYHRWRIDKSTDVMRVERRKGKAEDLILDFNLPGRSPAAMTYSAKVQIASKAGKIHE